MPAAPQPAQWFITKNDGQEAGPFSNQQMKTLVAQAKIGPATLVRRQGMPKAIPAANVQGLLTANSTVAVSRAAPPPPPPIPAEVDQVEPEEEPHQDDAHPGQGDDISLRAPVGMRIVSSLIDSVGYGFLVVVAFIVFVAFAFSGLSGVDSQIESRWREEVERITRSSNIEHHKRILGIERFPRPEESMQPVSEQVSAYRRMFAEVEAEPNPGELRDLIVLEWRSRREGGGPSGPVSEEEREAVLSWSQYTDFEGFVRRREIQLRRELRGNVERLDSLRAIFTQDLERAARSSGMRALIAGIVIFPVLVLFYPLFEAFLGGTPGKLVLGYRVTTLQRHPVGFAKGLLRMLLRIIPFYFVTAFTESRQGLHDSLSGTQVIVKDAVIQRSEQRRGRSSKKAGGRRRRR